MVVSPSVIPMFDVSIGEPHPDSFSRSMSRWVLLFTEYQYHVAAYLIHMIIASLFKYLTLIVVLHIYSADEVHMITLRLFCFFIVITFVFIFGLGCYRVRTRCRDPIIVDDI